MRAEGVEDTLSQTLDLSTEAAQIPFRRLHSLCKGVVLVSLFLGLYGPTIRGLVADWVTFYTHSHGFMIVALSAYLLWSRRRNLLSSLGKPSLGGLPVLLLGLGVFSVGALGGEELAERASLPITLFGLFFYLFGLEMARVVAFPVLYLFLMVPLPYTLFRDIAYALRLFDAKVVAWATSSLGIPIFLEGFMLHLPEISLEVADGCSGAFSSVALIALGIFYIHEMQRPKKILLWLLLVPIAVLANVVRIFVITVGVYYFGDWMLRSWVHQFSGVFNFLLGFGALVLLSTLAQHTFSKRPSL